MKPDCIESFWITWSSYIKTIRCYIMDIITRDCYQHDITMYQALDNGRSMLGFQEQNERKITLLTERFLNCQSKLPTYTIKQASNQPIAYVGMKANKMLRDILTVRSVRTFSLFYLHCKSFRSKRKTEIS